MSEVSGSCSRGVVTRSTDDPCARHGCHLCCQETRMTLTEADLARLEGAGFKNFARINDDGDLELRNVDGSCSLLVDGRCEAYFARPEGCRLYPMILDVSANRVIRDELCPHGAEFVLQPGHADRLRRSVARERDEAGHRRRRMDG